MWDLSNSSCSYVDPIDILMGHTGIVESVSALKDGRIISISDDKSLKIWTENKKGMYECTATLIGHEQGITKVIELKNGLLVSASKDKTLKVWDLRKPENKECLTKCVTTLKGHTDRVSSILELKNGCLVSTSTDGTLRVWDLSKSEKEECYVDTLDDDYSIQNISKISPIIELQDGSLIYTSEFSKEIKVWVTDNENGYTLQIIKDDIANKYIKIKGCEDGFLFTLLHPYIQMWSKSEENKYCYTNLQELVMNGYHNATLPVTRFNHNNIILGLTIYNRYEVFVLDSYYALNDKLSNLAERIIKMKAKSRLP